MSTPDFRKATAASLLMHTLFFLIILLMVKRQQDFILPPSYTVDLVTVEKPEPLKKSKVAGQKTIVKKKETPEKTAIKKAKIPGKKMVIKRTKPKEVSIKASRRRDAIIEQSLAKIRREKKIQEIARAKHKESPGVTGTVTGKGLSGRKLTMMEKYRVILEDHIKQHWVLPEIFKNHLKAEVSLWLKMDGSVKSVKLKKSSGNTHFDRTVINAIHRASPLPPPPFNYSDDFVVRFSPIDIR